MQTNPTDMTIYNGHYYKIPYIIAIILSINPDI